MNNEQRLAAFFDRKALTFDAIYSGDKNIVLRVWDRITRRNIHQRFAFTLRAGEPWGDRRVLDVGCGSGRYSVAAAKRGAREVVGLDLSPQMIELAEHLARESGVAEKCSFQLGDVMNYSGGHSFEVTLAIGFFDYVVDPLPVITRLCGLTSKMLVATFPSRYTLRALPRRLWITLNRCPIRFYSPGEVKGLLGQAGFDCQRLVRHGPVFTVVAVPGPSRTSVVGSPVCPSQSRMAPSAPAEARVLPSGDRWISRMVAVWPRHSRRSVNPGGTASGLGAPFALPPARLPACQQHHHRAELPDRMPQRFYQRHGPNGGDLCLAALTGDAAELLILSLLTGVRLHHADTGEARLQPFVDAGDALLQRCVPAIQERTTLDEDPDQDRQRTGRPERQQGIDDNHHRGDERDLGDRFVEAKDSRAGKPAQLLRHVVGQAGDQIADSKPLAEVGALLGGPVERVLSKRPLQPRIHPRPCRLHQGIEQERAPTQYHERHRKTGSQLQSNRFPRRIRATTPTRS